MSRVPWQELQEAAGFRPYDDFSPFEKVSVPANRTWILPRDVAGLFVPPEVSGFFVLLAV